MGKYIPALELAARSLSDIEGAYLSRENHGGRWRLRYDFTGIGGYLPNDSLVLVSADDELLTDLFLGWLALEMGKRRYRIGTAFVSNGALNFCANTLAAHTGIHPFALQDGHFPRDNWPTLTRVAGVLSESSLFFIEERPPSLGDIVGIIDKHKKIRHPLGYIVVDSIKGVMKPSNRLTGMAEYAHKAKTCILLKATKKELPKLAIPRSALTLTVKPGKPTTKGSIPVKILVADQNKIMQWDNTPSPGNGIDIGEIRDTSPDQPEFRFM